MFLSVRKKDLDEYVFGEDGLDLKEGISKKSLASWLNNQMQMLCNIGDELVESNDMSIQDAKLGFIPYALGDLVNFLQCLKEQGLK